MFVLLLEMMQERVWCGATAFRWCPAMPCTHSLLIRVSSSRAWPHRAASSSGPKVAHKKSTTIPERKSSLHPNTVTISILFATVSPSAVHHHHYPSSAWFFKPHLCVAIEETGILFRISAVLALPIKLESITITITDPPLKVGRHWPQMVSNARGISHLPAGFSSVASSSAASRPWHWKLIGGDSFAFGSCSAIFLHHRPSK